MNIAVSFQNCNVIKNLGAQIWDQVLLIMWTSINTFSYAVSEIHFCRPALNYNETLGTKSECLSRALINVYLC
jgi:hypothetical protein